MLWARYPSPRSLTDSSDEPEFLTAEASVPARCDDCDNAVFEIEFEGLCSGCQHFLHRAMED